MERTRSRSILLVAALAAACSSSSPRSSSVPIDPNRPGDPLFAEALSHYDAATAEQTAGFNAAAAGDTAGAQTHFATATSEFGVARSLFDQLAVQYCGASPSSGQTSIRCDNSAYLAGRCSYELGTMSKATGEFQDAVARLDAMEAAYPSSAMKDSAAYFDGRAHFQLGEWAAARAQLQLSLAADAAGTFADNAQYYLGRCWYEQGFALVNVVPSPAPGTADYVAASADFASAEAELKKVEATYPTSPYVVNARYYLGKTFFERPYDSSVSNTQRVSNLDTAAGYFGQVIAANGIFLAGAHYWRGRAHYALAFELASGGVLDAAQLAAALPDLKAVPPPDTYADNALYYVVKVYANEQVCSAGTDPAPASACDAYAALKALAANDPLYAGSPYVARAQSYLQTNLPSCTCAW